MPKFYAPVSASEKGKTTPQSDAERTKASNFRKRQKLKRSKQRRLQAAREGNAEKDDGNSAQDEGSGEGSGGDEVERATKHSPSVHAPSTPRSTAEPTSSLKMMKRALELKQLTEKTAARANSSHSKAPKPAKESKPAPSTSSTRAEAVQLRPSSSAPAPSSSALTPLQQSMKEKLEAAQFRYLNERLYVSSSAEAWALLQREPELFALYHRGFALQVRAWPLHPLDVIIGQLKAVTDRELHVADLGCGEARLSLALAGQHRVSSFDLVAANERVVAADIMAHVPLSDSAVDVAVFCLSLMGTNLAGALAEARRVLRPGGLLKVAEVASRFNAESLSAFLAALKALGFKLIARYAEHRAEDYFVLLTFKLAQTKPPLPTPLPHVELKPCLYKRR